MGGLEALWQFTSSELLNETATWLLVIVLLIAGLYKIRHPSIVAFNLVECGVLRTARRPLGLGLGIVELMVAIGLSGLLGSYLAGLAAMAVTALCIAYTVLVAAALRSGRVLHCGCFSSQGAPIDSWTLARNLVLVWASLSAVEGQLGEVVSISTSAQGIVVATCLIGVASSLRMALTATRGWSRISNRLDWETMRSVAEGGT